MVVQTKLYADVVTYADVVGDVWNISAQGTMAYVDFTGKDTVTSAVHIKCGTHLHHSLMVGMTDWESSTFGASGAKPKQEMPGPKPTLFFVPAYIEERAKETSKRELYAKCGMALAKFYPTSRTMLTAETVVGANAVAQAWVDLVDNKVAPSRGLICKFK